MLKSKIFIVVNVLSLIVLNSCVHEIQNSGSGGNGGVVNPPVAASCSQDTVYFQNTVLPLLNSSCAMSGCHDAATHKEDINLTTYASIMSTGGVKAGNPGASKLYSVLGKSMPPSGYAPFTQAQKDIIYKWILQGANNNACNGCDTAVFTFSGAVSPLMNTYCKGCHNPASLGGGIDLNSFTTIQAQALNGKLMGSITHASGFSPMPKGSTQLSDCQIQQVQNWITAGTLNN